MATIIRCSCGKKVSIADAHLGQRMRCPACGGTFATSRDTEQVQAAAPEVAVASQARAAEAGRAESTRAASGSGHVDHVPPHAAPSLWINEAKRPNVLILTDDSLYVDNVALRYIDEVERGLEEGEAPDEVLGDRQRCIRFADIAHVSYQDREPWPHSASTGVEIVYDDEDERQTMELAFDRPEDRGEFMKDLVKHLGWKSTEARASLWPRGAIYAALFLGSVSITLLAALIEYHFGLLFGPAGLVIAAEAAGVWGILIIGGMLDLHLLLVLLYAVRHPPMVVRYAPGPAAEDE
jgi:hypothetical protein